MKNKIIKLEKKKCLTLRPLWEEVFSEDSVRYTDFYFKEKAGRNTAFALLAGEPEGKERGYDENPAVAMVHLSPYDIEMRVGEEFTRIKVNYMVGVATAGQHRHKGYMDALLKVSLKEMYDNGQPFTFLMPASPKIYEPYQFAYIYNKMEYEIDPILGKGKELKAASVPNRALDISLLKVKDIPKIVQEVNRYLKENKDVFIFRDEDYYRMLVKELEVQDGAVYLVRNKNKRLEGCFLCTKDSGKADIQEALSFHDHKGMIGKNGILIEKGRKPMIMARIVHVQAMLSLLRIKPDVSGINEEVILNISVTDPLLPANNGIWQCRTGREEANVIKTQKENTECSVTVDRLASWIFGYKKPEECFTFEKTAENVLYKLKKINIFSNVFINEIT